MKNFLHYTSFLLFLLVGNLCSGKSNFFKNLNPETCKNTPYHLRAMCTTPGAPIGVSGTATGPTSASLDWFAGSPAGSPTVTYHWQLSTSYSFSSGTIAAQGSTTTFWAGASSLTPSTTYYLRVRATTSCDGSYSGYSSIASFTTPPGTVCSTPGAPIGVSGTATGPTSASLDWFAGSPVGSPTVTYHWQLSTSYSFSSGTIAAQGSTNTFWAGASSLTPSTTYYLRVRATTSCDGSYSGYSSIASFTTPPGTVCTTPGAPIGVSGTATGPTSASLDWFAGSPVGSPNVTYFWVIGTSSSVTYGSGVAQGTTSGSWVGVNSLIPNTTYYLRVYATTSCNGTSSSYSTSASFTTPPGTVCTTPGAPVGVSGTATGPTSASLDWFAGSPAGSPTVTYHWQLSTSYSFSSGTIAAQGSTTTFWAGASSLTPSTTYYLRVRATTSCDGSYSGYSSIASFTTPPGTVCTTPGAPVGVSGTATGPTSASLDWFAGSPAGSPTVTYHWQLSTSYSFSSGTIAAQGSTTTFWAGASSLTPSTTYYLRVRATTSCDGSYSGYSSIASFTTPSGTVCTTPGAPIGVSGTATGPTSASLDWFAGSPVGSPNVTYFWVIGTSSSVTYGSGVAQGTTSGSWVGVNSLIPNTTYYLRVYATTSCNGTSSSYSTSASFTTPPGTVCTTPGAPIGVSGTATGPTSASLDWFAGSPAGSPTVTYHWQLSTSYSFSSGTIAAQGSTTTFWAGASSLTPSTTYYLRVRATTSCDGSYSGYSSIASFTTPPGTVCTTPGAPIGVSGTATGPTSASLDWFAGSPVGSPTVTYHWQLSTSYSFSSGTIAAQGSTTTFWAGASSLTPSTTYYLRVRATTSCDGSYSGYSSIASFTTPPGTVCTTPGAPIGVSGTATGPTSASLDWFAGSPAGSPTVTYHWQLSTSYSFSSGTIVAQGSTNTFWAGASSLTPSTTYYLRVRATTSCDGSYSGYSSIASFTTPPGTVCTTPGAPIGVSGTATGPTSASLDWFAGSPAGSPTVTYHWQLSTSYSFSSGTIAAQGSTTTFWAGASSLTPSTTYYLRVRATTSCDGSYSGYSSIASFTTPPGTVCTTPGAPIGVSGTATGPTSASLDWFAGSPVGSPTVTYHWQLSTSYSFSSGTIVAQGSTNIFWAGASSLTPSTTYYLRVRATTSCDGSYSGYSSIASFTTPPGTVCTTPGAPIGVSGTATGPTSASLDWFAGSPAGSPTVTYHWQLSTSYSFSSGTIAAQGSTTTFWAGASSLTPSTTYYLRVRATTSCDGSYSGYSSIASFTTPPGTVCTTPGAPIGVSGTATGPTSASLDWFAGSPAGSPTVTYHWQLSTSYAFSSGTIAAQGSTNTFWAGASSLTPSTTYYLRVRATTSCDGSYSGYSSIASFTTHPVVPSCVTPGTPINVTGTPTNTTTARLDWSAGVPNGSDNITYYWVIGTSPSVTYGNGVTQGYTSSNWFIYSGLQPGTTYYLRVYAKTSCNNTTSAYGTSAPFITPTSNGCAAPVLQASHITFSLVSTQSFRIKWLKGNGSRRVVKINTTNNFTNPQNGSDPAANNQYSGSGEQVVYNGSDTTVLVTGLPLNSTIWVRIYEANCSGSSSVYNHSPSINNPVSQNTITVVPAMHSFVVSTVGLNSNNEEVQVPFYTIRNFNETIPVLHLLSDGSASTRFTLNASNAGNFGFRVIDSIGRVVSDSNRTVDLAKFGKLGTPSVLAHDKIEARFTHPTIPHTTLNQQLKLQILYDGGLLGIDVPISYLRPNAPLSAEIVDLSGKYNKNHHHNELSWTTLSESNNDYFEIQRKSGNSGFIALESISGTENSSIPIQYHYTDKDINYSHTYTYRLRQVDFDGKETYSDQILIKVADPASAKPRLSPNPAKNIVYIETFANVDDQVNVQVFNMSGQKILSEIFGQQNSGISSFEFNTSSLQKGMYNVMIQVNGHNSYHKLLIVD